MSIFSKVALSKPKRNLFNLSHDNKFSCQLGQLIPILCEPVVPGDTFKVSSELMVRMAPMVFPIMQQIDVYVHYFYVPNRLTMGEKYWEKFISPHATASDPSPAELIPPSIDLNAAQASSVLPFTGFCNIGELGDFLGYNQVYDSGKDSHLYASILPVNAYNLIYANYYIDQNVGESPDDFKIVDGSGYYSYYDIERKLGDASKASEYFKLRNRAWKKDYFTSALPFTQRGEDVHLPLYGDGSDAIIPTAKNLPVEYDPNLPVYVTDSNGEIIKDGRSFGTNSDDGHLFIRVGSSASPEDVGAIKQNGFVSSSQVAASLALDLNSINAATINEFRRANALQKFLEISARVGARYKEFVLGHFGVNVPDGRLQRPEYLGGGVAKIQISEVLQTSASVQSGEDVSPLADMAGHGIGVGRSNSFTHSFPEHGYVMGIMSIIPKAAYYQGIRRDLLKLDRLDFYQPEFANIGEQPIYNAELFARYKDAKGTFGYTPRYAEYKYIPSGIHGKFRTDMDSWHMARKFGSAPTLSKDFIEVNEYKDNLNRVFAVEGSADDPIEHFYVYCYNQVKALRPMPYFGTPIL